MGDAAVSFTGLDVTIVWFGFVGSKFQSILQLKVVAIRLPDCSLCDSIVLLR